MSDSTLMNTISSYLHLKPDTLENIVLTLATIAIVMLMRHLAVRLARRKIEDGKKIYRTTRTVNIIANLLMLVLIGHVWLDGFKSITTFLGLASAGVAIALHDTIANIAGWLFIISRKPFTVGDRIQIGKTAGDVIDIRMFQFSVIEIGNWVAADQSTGRIIHVPNCIILREPLANYQVGF